MIKLEKKKLQVIHITAVREISAGQRKQLKYEYCASHKLENINWTTLVLHTGVPVEPFERRIPLAFRFLFLRNLYAWCIALRLAKDVDFILLRHMTFDPFALLFAPLIKNRVSVHHSREVEELLLIRKGFMGRMASSLEKITGKFAVKRAIGVLGVTNDIAQYQSHISIPNKPYHTYPNGISLDEIILANDNRDLHEVSVVFICGTFSEWHGLDRLIKAVDDIQTNVSEILKIHLIGKLSDFQKQEINATDIRRKVFNLHGTLRTDQYMQVIEKCDIGLGSLAMDRQNLVEGSTLKVRELLAMGIPVYSGHIDTALSSNFLFYNYTKHLEIDNMIEFAKNMKSYSRLEVRQAATPFIDKTLILESMDKKLNNFF